jgi:hypothetical protein
MLTEVELSRLASLVPEHLPWKAWVEGRDGLSFSSFIQQADGDGPDLYFSRDEHGQSQDHLDLIALAVTVLPNLLAEARGSSAPNSRLRAELRALLAATSDLPWTVITTADGSHIHTSGSEIRVSSDEFVPLSTLEVIAETVSALPKLIATTGPRLTS